LGIHNTGIFKDYNCFKMAKQNLLTFMHIQKSSRY
jgi:hypothetical protein